MVPLVFHVNGTACEDALERVLAQYTGVSLSSLIPAYDRGAGHRWTNKQMRNAFLRLHGFWLGDGSIRLSGRTRGYVVFAQKKRFDFEYLRLHFQILGFTEGTEWREFQKTDGIIEFCIVHGAFVDFMCAEYALKYQNGDAILRKYHHPRVLAAARAAYERSAYARVKAITGESVTSVKWLAPWMLELTAEESCHLLDGLTAADGASPGSKDFKWTYNVVYTSGLRFRDEVMHLAVRAGLVCSYAFHMKAGTKTTLADGRVITLQHDAWKVHITWPYHGGLVHDTKLEIVAPEASWGVVMPSRHHLVMCHDSEGSRPIVLRDSSTFESVTYDAFRRTIPRGLANRTTGARREEDAKARRRCGVAVVDEVLAAVKAAADVAAAAAADADAAPAAAAAGQRRPRAEDDEAADAPAARVVIDVDDDDS
jgi:hypothetical protein